LRKEIGMTDQAERLRQLALASRVSSGTAAAVALDEPCAAVPGQAAASPLTTRSLLFTSGKGGVGTSNLVLNLAIALGEMGQRVVVVDADLGLANLDLLCGLTPRFDLGDVLAGRCRLFEAVATGPGDIQIVPGAHAIRTGSEDLGGGPARLVSELSELEFESDFVLVDGGSGLGAGIVMLAAAADEVVVVSTPEPTSIADLHAAIGRFQRLPGRPRLRVLINQARSASEAVDVLDRVVASSRQFLGAVVSPLGPGSIRVDPHVPAAVRCRRPFLVAYPTAAASRGVRRLARALVQERQPAARNRRIGFFAGLAARRALAPRAGG
jgi:flagellar biosynthesis protein FlhG